MLLFNIINIWFPYFRLLICSVTLSELQSTAGAAAWFGQFETLILLISLRRRRPFASDASGILVDDGINIIWIQYHI